jgi:CheY-like chemotaxis protein
MPRTILVADDSPTIRRLVAQTFADADFRIVEVNNGDSAIKTFEELRPNVVLADIYMPAKNGYQVCAHIRNHPKLGRTPVVLLVGAFDAFDEAAARKAGATASITKPFEPGALIELVTSIMLPESPISDDLEPPASAVPAEDDLLGLESIFKAEPEPITTTAAITEEVIDRIADRVIQRISTQVIESVAWDVVPDITEKIVREELKRINET